MRSSRKHAIVLKGLLAMACLAANGCVDAVREGAVTGAGEFAQTAVGTVLGFSTVGLEVLLQKLTEALGGG